jgi:hypothetical protein
MQLRLSKFDTGSAFRSTLDDQRGARVMPVYTYTTVDDPLATLSQAAGINDSGQIVGLYFSNAFHGFLYSGGTFTALDDPLATISTIAQGVNNAGQIVGWYINASGTHGFLLSGDHLHHARRSLSREGHLIRAGHLCTGHQQCGPDYRALPG